MPVISRALSIPLRIGEIAFGAVVAGIVGSYLHHAYRGAPKARFIYVEIIAALSILFGLIWLIPFAAGFIHFPIDLLLTLAWFAAFAVLVNYVHGTNCSHSVFNWGGITDGGTCNRWRAAEAFSFLSACFWLASALLGMWFIYRERKRRTRDVNVNDPVVAQPMSQNTGGMGNTV